VTLLLIFGLTGPALAQDESIDELIDEGGPLFEDNCSVCHGTRGEGTGNGPTLGGNTNVKDRALVVNQVLWGDSDHGMPSFVDVLNDREIAAIATFVRNSWGNDYGIVFPRSVELRR
jgi:mono/diheme cytochrome c family protein